MAAGASAPVLLDKRVSITDQSLCESLEDDAPQMSDLANIALEEKSELSRLEEIGRWKAATAMSRSPHRRNQPLIPRSSVDICFSFLYCHIRDEGAWEPCRSLTSAIMCRCVMSPVACASTTSLRASRAGADSMESRARDGPRRSDRHAKNEVFRQPASVTAY